MPSCTFSVTEFEKMSALVWVTRLRVVEMNVHCSAQTRLAPVIFGWSVRTTANYHSQPSTTVELSRLNPCLSLAGDHAGVSDGPGTHLSDILRSPGGPYSTRRSSSCNQCEYPRPVLGSNQAKKLIFGQRHRARFTQNGKADLHANLRANPFMLLASCVKIGNLTTESGKPR